MAHKLWLLSLSIILIIGCTEEEEDNKPKKREEEDVKPTISLKTTPSEFLQLNDSLFYQLVLNSESDAHELEHVKMEVQKELNPGSYQTIPSYTENQTQHGRFTGPRFRFVLPEDDFNVHDSLRIKFTVESSNGQTKTKSHSIVIGELMTESLSRALEKDFVQINHKFTPRRPPENQFDLYFSESKNTIGYLVDGNGEKADIRDNSVSDSTFERQWISQTTTRFVKTSASEINFQHPLDVRVRNIYSNSAPSSSVNNIAKDDLIIAKVRNAPKFLVLKITEVYENPDQITKSYIRFRAKGKNIF